MEINLLDYFIPNYETEFKEIEIIDYEIDDLYEITKNEIDKDNNTFYYANYNKRNWER